MFYVKRRVKTPSMRFGSSLLKKVSKTFVWSRLSEIKIFHFFPLIRDSRIYASETAKELTKYNTFYKNTVVNRIYLISREQSL